MRFCLLPVCMLVAVLLVHSARAADATWVSFRDGAESIRALIALPSGPEPHAAVIYNHGRIVRVQGHEAASNQGYDTEGYVEALADAGYIAIAPIRDHLATADVRSAVAGGSETLLATIDYLKRRPDVDATRIGAVGFSEGGLVTLWSAISGADLTAMVLMSPAAMEAAGDRNLEAAVQEDALQSLAMPVMLTVGAQDFPSIRTLTESKLIPGMQRLGKRFSHKTDYPGDHRWFWLVRPDHFEDVRAFLAEHLM